ncbi:MAG: Coenzyme F420 hydrogenase/dehydrogenase, beta subunit C-terminal domain [Ruminococcus sp.]|nr:Coenzyme F420 hydrogenase/dehydrogenase, beta subunit C-terminal domain [Ruminococcus sp.]
MQVKNIEGIGQVHKCTSCQMCGAVCPTDAISFHLNSDGFYRPLVDEGKCINCGKCQKVCYKFDSKIRVSSSLKNIKLYGAYSIDKELLTQTTSGGVADILAKQLIKEGYRCIGVAYDSSCDKAIGAIASDELAITSFRGSKYIQSYSFEAFRELVRNCRNTKFAVFGLPCQIYGIDRFLDSIRKREEHVLIDLYCHGCPSMLVWDKYAQEIKSELGIKEFEKVNFRSKIRGWGDFCVGITVKAKDGITTLRVKNKKEFYTLFFSDMVLNDACPDCQLRSTFEYTDIRLGDFWGHSYVKNHTGVSAVTIITERGGRIWNNISTTLVWEERSFSELLPYQSYGKIYKVNNKVRIMMLDSLRKKELPLNETITIWHKSLSFPKRIKLSLKKFVNLLPISWTSLVKSLYYKL